MSMSGPQEEVVSMISGGKARVGAVFVLLFMGCVSGERPETRDVKIARASLSGISLCRMSVVGALPLPSRSVIEISVDGRGGYYLGVNRVSLEDIAKHLVAVSGTQRFDEVGRPRKTFLVIAPDTGCPWGRIRNLLLIAAETCVGIVRVVFKVQSEVGEKRGGFALYLPRKGRAKQLYGAVIDAFVCPRGDRLYAIDPRSITLGYAREHLESIRGVEVSVEDMVPAWFVLRMLESLYVLGVRDLGVLSVSEYMSEADSEMGTGELTGGIEVDGEAIRHGQTGIGYSGCIVFECIVGFNVSRDGDHSEGR